MMRKTLLRAALAGALSAGLGLAHAQDATYNIRTLTPETALKAAQAALKSCRDGGFQVAVAVVDRSGLAQVMLRDRFAGSHTPDTATRKAYTAVSFRTATSEMAKLIRSGQLEPGLAQLPHTAMIGGGLMIEAAGSMVGGIGVSGAPGGDKDDECAKAGIDAIRDKLDF